MIYLYIAVALIMALALLLLLSVRPAPYRDAQMDAVYAHRGYHDATHPENSLSAFARAHEYNLAVELDVQLTRDGKVVVFHDEKLSRMCGEDKAISDMDYEELKEISFTGFDEHVPLFSDVLNTLDGESIICEIKTHKDPKDCTICPLIAEYIDNYSGHIVIESFSPYILKWFKENRPDIIRGQLSQNFTKHGGLGGINAVLLGNFITNFLAKPDFLAYNYEDITLGFSLATLFGPTLVAWTVRSKAELEKAAMRGYGVFICEGFQLEKALEYDD